jgi:hypothetical protein
MSLSPLSCVLHANPNRPMIFPSPPVVQLLFSDDGFQQEHSEPKHVPLLASNGRFSLTQKEKETVITQYSLIINVEEDVVRL